MSARRRGTASVEIVVMLPMFFVLFAASYYLHGVVSAAEEAGVASRGCVWAHAMAGCPQVKPPPCAKLDVGAPKELEAGEYDLTEPDSRPSWFDAIVDVPLVGSMVEAIFGEAAQVSAARDARALMSPERVKLVQRHYLVCNSVAQDWNDRAKDFVNYMAGTDF